MNITYSGFEFVVDTKPAAPSNEQVSRLERAMLEMPQLDLQTCHCLSGMVYARSIFIPAGGVLTGAEHKKDHVNIVFGDITVSTDDGMKRLTGFHVLPTKAGMKRVGYAHEDTHWVTCCHTQLEDIPAIEDELVKDAHLLQTRRAITFDTKEKLEA
jgi:hypothetical protein